MTSKTYLITGAAQRIGAAIAQELAAHGSKVIVNYASSSAAADKVRREPLAGIPLFVRLSRYAASYILSILFLSFVDHSRKRL